MHGQRKARVPVRGLSVTIFFLTEERSSERLSGLLKVTPQQCVTESPRVPDIWPFPGPSLLIPEFLQHVLKLGRQVFILGQRVHNEHLTRC